MPYKDPEKKKLKDREWREKNKERKKQIAKQWYENNKEKNKEKHRQYNKEWTKTEQGKKSMRIGKWKNRGIIFFDYDLLYDIYINTSHCDNCNCKLTEDKLPTKTTRCLDHDHNITDYDNVRNILCTSCNIKRG